MDTTEIRKQITEALKRWEDSRTYSTNVMDHYEAANVMRDTLQRVLVALEQDDEH